MACGCNRKLGSVKTPDPDEARARPVVSAAPREAAKTAEPAEPAGAVFRKARENSVMPMNIGSGVSRSNGDEYSGGLGCAQCYVKHLSKAAVEAAEYFETSGREAEFVLCLGDLACAEDHARALGMERERLEIRSIRDMLWEGRSDAVGVITGLATGAVKAISRAARAKASTEAAKSAADGSNA